VPLINLKAISSLNSAQQLMLEQPQSRLPVPKNTKIKILFIEEIKFNKDPDLHRVAQRISFFVLLVKTLHTVLP